jgi:hypothetical protein
MNGRSLVEIVHGLLVRTYGIRVRLPDLGRFIVGDRGYQHLYGGEVEVASGLALGAEGAAAARTLVRETPEGVRLSVYLPDDLVRCLEEHPPQRGLGEANVDAFATLVEELDHLLCIAERASEGRPVTPLELELHANVSKHLVLARFLSGRGRPLGPRERAWLRWHLFDKGTYCDRDPAVRERYREAARWAVRFLSALRLLTAEERIATLRRFHRASAAEKLQLIRSMAA